MARPPAARPAREVWPRDKAVEFFKEKDVGEARRSAELLLAHALGCTRIDLYLRFEQPLRADELETFRGYVRRRLKREPVQYILGRTEFYGLEFRVTPARAGLAVASACRSEPSPPG